MKKYFVCVMCLNFVGVYGGNTWSRLTKKPKDPLKEVIEEMRSYLEHMDTTSITTRTELGLYVRARLKRDRDRINNFPALLAFVKQAEFENDPELGKYLAAALADTCLDFIDKKMQVSEK